MDVVVPHGKARYSFLLHFDRQPVNLNISLSFALKSSAFLLAYLMYWLALLQLDLRGCLLRDLLILILYEFIPPCYFWVTSGQTHWATNFVLKVLRQAQSRIWFCGIIVAPLSRRIQCFPLCHHNFVRLNIKWRGPNLPKWIIHIMMNKVTSKYFINFWRKHLAFVVQKDVSSCRVRSTKRNTDMNLSCNIVEGRANTYILKYISEKPTP